MTTLTQTSTDVLHRYIEEKHGVPVTRCNLQCFYREEASCFEILHPLGSCIVFVVVKNGFSLEDPFLETVCEHLCEKGYCSYFITESECEDKTACAESFGNFCFRKNTMSSHDQVVIRGLMDYDLIPACYKIEHMMVDGKHCCRVWCTNDCNESYLYADLCWVRERKCEVLYASGHRYKFTADPQLQHTTSPKQNAVIISPRGRTQQAMMQKSATPMMQKSDTQQPPSVGFSDFGSYVTGDQRPLSSTRLVPRSGGILSLSPKKTYDATSPIPLDGSNIQMKEYPPIPLSQSQSVMPRLVSDSRSNVSNSIVQGSQRFISADKIQDELLNQSMRRSATLPTVSQIPSASMSQSSYLPTVSQIPSASMSQSSYLPTVSQIPSASMSQSSYLPTVSQIPSASMSRSSYLPTVRQIPFASRTPVSGPSLRISNRTATPYPLNVSYSPAGVIDEENVVPPMSVSDSYARTSPQFV